MRIFLLSVLMTGLYMPAAARNVALVIGNANYKITPLKNPRRDAAAIADRLKDLGFDVSEVFDGDAFTMNRAAEGFLRAASGADFALFYFAGHGIQLFDRNYLLARDIDTLPVSSPSGLGLDLPEFMQRLRRSGAVRHALLIDACRDNPLTFDETVALVKRLKGPESAPATEAARRTSRGLASVQIPDASQSRGSSETLVFFAAQPGAVSYDGDGQNSYFVEGIKEGLSEPGRPLSEVFRKAGAYVRTVSKGEQVPQVVSDWTGDVTLGAAQAAKVSYNISPSDEKRPLSKSEQNLLIRSVAGYTRFAGDFIVRASQGAADSSDLTEDEKKKANELGSINGFSIAYDIDRDGRDEIIHVYFRQVNYVIVIEKDGVRVEADTCFGQEPVTEIEVALKDINGDRRPEVWIAYDTGSHWSTFCILEFKGIANLDKYRRGNTGLMQGGTEVFRTLLRAGADWGVTAGNDNSIKVCAGSNCHSPAAYTFGGEYFRMQYSELGSEPDLLKGIPFRDEKERAQIIYSAYRKAAIRKAASSFQASSRDNDQTVDVTATLGGVDFGYSCSRFGEGEPSESLLLRWPASVSAKTGLSLPEALTYSENLSVAPVTIDGERCVADSISSTETSYQIAFSQDTASRCIPRLARAGSVLLPVLASERGLLQAGLGESRGREKIAIARAHCFSGSKFAPNREPEQAREEPPQESAPPAPFAAERFAGFARRYLESSVPYAESVEYYRESRPRQFIIADKQKYYSRWPVRTYTLDPSTLKVSRHGSEANVRDIEFEYTFRVANGREVRAGRGRARLAVEDAGGTLLIRSEDGQVLQRF